MKILIDNITPGESSSASAIGGMRDYLYHFVINLKKQCPSANITVLSPNWNNSVFFEKNVDIDEIFISSPRKNYLRIIYEKLFLANIVNKINPDTYIGMNSSLQYGINAKKIFFIKSIQYLTNPSAYGFIKRKFLRRNLFNSIKMCDHAIISSNFAKQKLIKSLNLSNEYSTKIKVIHEAPYINKKDFEKNDSYYFPELDRLKNPILLTVGGLYKYKQTDLIIKSFYHFINLNRKTYDLVIIGAEAGDQIKNLLKLCDDLGIRNSVYFFGHKDRDFILRAYKKCQLFLFFSMMETFGHPILEAMMAKATIVTTNEHIHKEIAGENSFLICSKIAEEIGMELNKIILDEERITEKKNNYYEWLANFNWERIVFELAKII